MKKMKTNELVMTAILTAIVVVLQLLAVVLARFGIFTISTVLVPIVIGGKKKEEYSTEAALTSLNNFADSAGMKVIFHYQFNECLLADDIKNKKDDINKMIDELIKKIK